jgi:hypothetical protein
MALVKKMLPEYWVTFVELKGLTKAEIEIPAAADLSEIDDEGVGLYIFDEKMSDDESSNYYPGVGVKKSGFVPVAGCQLGTGDPYFININDGKCGPLYRIYHDQVFDENFDRGRAVDLVLKNYEDLASYKTT